MDLCFGVVNGVEVAAMPLKSFDLNFPIVCFGQMFMGISSDEKLMIKTSRSGTGCAITDYVLRLGAQISAAGRPNP
jgi:hypothetical protein